MKRIGIISLVLALISSVIAAGGSRFASAQGFCRHLCHPQCAIIVTVTGPAIENGTVVISRGKIAAVGATASVPAGAKIIDGKGLSVYPGMMDSDTEIGFDRNRIGCRLGDFH